MQGYIIAACSFVLALVFGKLAIPALRALHAGQSIREIGPNWHNSKAGTPTMGGLIFMLSTTLCTVAAGWKGINQATRGLTEFSLRPRFYIAHTSFPIPAPSWTINFGLSVNMLTRIM